MADAREGGRPEWADARRLGIFGGTFDPVHLGHLHAARTAREARALDRVVFVPAARSPHRLEHESAPAADRVAMLALALSEEPAFALWGVELERPGPSYTIDTLEALAGLRPEAAPPFLILGSDNLAGLASWRRVEELLARVEPLVVLRRGLSASELDDVCGGLSRRARERIAAGFFEAPTVDVAATEVRRALGEGRLPEDALPPGVGEYALERGVYRHP